MKVRKEVKEKNQWNLKKMFKTQKDFDKAFAEAEKDIVKVLEFRGKLKSKTSILKCFTLTSQICRKLEYVYVYASLKHSEDLSNNTYGSLYKKVQALYASFSSAVSFVDPELLKLSDEKLKVFAKDKDFKVHKLHLKSLIKQKKHLLSDAEEAILAKGAEIYSGPYNIFSTMDNVCIDFGEIKTLFGKEKITHGSYQKLLENKKEKVRKEAYTKVYEQYKKYAHVYCEMLNLKVKQNIYLANVRKYDSALERALLPNNINPKVYETLVAAANKKLPTLHKYFAYRAKAMKKDKLNMWDLRVPLSKVNMEIEYSKGVDYSVNAVEVLGEDYQNTLKDGLLNGWVDRYENAGKRSGAFSSGMYDTDPYILMNYSNTLNDVFTLTHEGGHSMHSYLSKNTQPYELADYTIFIAEIASTFNERLLSDYLLKSLPAKYTKYIALNEIDAIRSTFFRQTMFAEFELLIHQEVENGNQLNVDRLCEIYSGLNAKYHGKNVITDDSIAYEWARIPHFYYNFYVYQYATGITAAYYFSNEVVKGNKEIHDKYIRLLKSGGNDYPVSQLKKAGIDMLDVKIYNAISKRLDELLKQI